MTQNLNSRKDIILEIRSRIESQIQPTHLEIIDDSKKHASHKEAKNHPKAGHFNLIISSQKFENLKLLEQHKLIKNILKDMIPEQIHALSIKILP